MLSRLVIAFLPRSKRLLISRLQSPSAVILKPKKTVCYSFHCLPMYLPWSDGTGCLDFSFWMLSFKPDFSLSSFTFIKKLFSSSSFSAIRLVSSAYLSLLIFLAAILIPACASSSLVFHMMYSAYKLNKQGDNSQPWCTHFLISNQSVVPCPVLTVFLDPDLLVQIFSLLYFNFCSVFTVRFNYESNVVSANFSFLDPRVLHWEY